MSQKIKVLMIGPARDVKGGMTSVINNYYKYGLDNYVDLKYLETINDKNFVLKFIKEIKGKIQYSFLINKYEIVHIHMASRRSTFRKIQYIKKAKKNNKRIILHMHGAEFRIFYEECSEKEKSYIKKYINFADKIIVLSEEWKEFFKNLVDEEKITVIYNSIVIPKDFDKDLNTQKILFLGRFGQRKGIYDLLDVVEKLVKEYPNLTLEAGGDGEVQQVKELVIKKNLEKNVKILGWINEEEKEKKLKEATFYVLPSYNEGMPMSLIEGMAYKNIGISTNVGGIPKVIETNQNGILIKPGDKIALYNVIKNLLEDEKLRKKLSQNGRNTVEKKFNIDINIQKVISIYENLIGDM